MGHQRRTQGSDRGNLTIGPGSVGVGSKLIEFKIPIDQLEYDGYGLLPKAGIEIRCFRAYLHYVHNWNVNDPLSTYDGASEDNKRLIVDFY